MAVAGGAAGGAVAAANAAQAAASAASAATMSSVSGDGLAAFFVGQELRCLRIESFYSYKTEEKNHRDYMLFARITRAVTATKQRGFFSRKEVLVTKEVEESVAMPEAIRRLLPPTATVISLAINWHNDCVRVYYVIPKKA